MIAVVIGGRRSIRALADYVLHDQANQATATDPRPVSSGRVEWTACLGVPMTDPQLMVRCMQGLAADAAILKSLAGVPASGRKLSNPYEHVVLSWPEGTKPPSRAHALDTVQGALDALGLDDRHRGIVVAHADTDSPHVHVLVSRVCPETGRAVKVTKPAVRRLQRWAVDYERRTGGVVIDNRVRRQQARAAFTAEVAALKAAGVPEKDAVDVARENNPLPPQRPRSERRSAGREKHTARERDEWRELSERQREQPDLHSGRAKAERIQLAQRQTRRRKRQKVFAPLTKLKPWKPAPDTTPGRTEPAPKAATARIPGPDLQRLEAQIGAKRDQTRDQTFEVAVRNDRAARRTLRAAARDHAAARDALAAATRATSRWTPNRQRSSEQDLAYLDADEHRDQARDAELVAEGRAGWKARNRQEARDRWRAAAADKRRARQDRRQQARENRPARRRLHRLRQRVADLRRRLTTLDTALKAVERVLDRLGLSRRSAPPAPPPDLSPSLSSIMRDLDGHIEHNYPAPAPEPVRVAEPERPLPSTISPATRVRREPPARERSPAAAPAGSREAGPRAQPGRGPDRRGVRRRLSPLAGALGVRADERDGRREASRAEGGRPGAAQGGGRPPTGLDVGGAATRAVQPLQAGVSEGLGGRREGLAGAAGPGRQPADAAGPGGRSGRTGAAEAPVRTPPRQVTGLRRYEHLLEDHPHCGWAAQVQDTLQAGLALRDRRNAGRLSARGLATARGGLLARLSRRIGTSGWGAALVAAIGTEVDALLGPGCADAADFEAVEQAVRDQAVDIAAHWVAQRFNADDADHSGSTTACACGRRARYAGRRPKTFTTLLGPVALQRAYYYPCGACRRGCVRATRPWPARHRGVTGHHAAGGIDGLRGQLRHVAKAIYGPGTDLADRWASDRRAPDETGRLDAPQPAMLASQACTRPFEWFPETGNPPAGGGGR